MKNIIPTKNLFSHDFVHFSILIARLLGVAAQKSSLRLFIYSTGLYSAFSLCTISWMSVRFRVCARECSFIRLNVEKTIFSFFSQTDEPTSIGKNVEKTIFFFLLKRTSPRASVRRRSNNNNICVRDFYNIWSKCTLRILVISCTVYKTSIMLYCNLCGLAHTHDTSPPSRIVIMRDNNITYSITI